MTLESLIRHREDRHGKDRACRIVREDNGQRAFVTRIEGDGRVVCADLSGEHSFLGFIISPADLALWSPDPAQD